jgi:hydroxypyruvate reductase
MPSKYLHMQAHMSHPTAIKILRGLFDSALSKAYPTRALAGYLPPTPRGRPVVVGAGKASAAMSQALDDVLTQISDSLVLVPYGHERTCRSVNIVEASHPVPDTAGQKGAQKILDLASSLGADDLLICLLSGGGSALLSLPPKGVTLTEKKDITRRLLACGASIHQINTVRKHLSAIKGGRLAAAAFPARTLTLTISDVPGDDPATIASGPTVGDPTTGDEALGILESFGIQTPASIASALASPDGESPFPGDATLAHSEFHIAVTAADALDAAVAYARQNGFKAINLGDQVEGIASVLASDHAKIFEQKLREQPDNKGLALLSGGEATVVLHGAGKGGPNQEYLLALAIALDGRPDVFAIAADTDGIDGASEAAGAVITPDTLARAAGLAMDPREYLARNDAGSFFEQLGDLIVTGPTCTNVNDFRAIAYIPERG